MTIARSRTERHRGIEVIIYGHELDAVRGDTPEETVQLRRDYIMGAMVEALREIGLVPKPDVNNPPIAAI